MFYPQQNPRQFFYFYIEIFKIWGVLWSNIISIKVAQVWHYATTEHDYAGDLRQLWENLPQTQYVPKKPFNILNIMVNHIVHLLMVLR